MTTNIYMKLQKARVQLQGKSLKKSGKNKFANYEYFEIEDFLPAIQVIFESVGLCGVVTFSSETASLEIHDTESNDFIAFQAPMANAELKGCHAIQNMGAVISYMRRYLWMLAMEIVEADALDATTGKEKIITEKKPESKATVTENTVVSPEEDSCNKSELLNWQAKIEETTNRADLDSTWLLVPVKYQPSLKRIAKSQSEKFKQAA